MKKTNCFTLFSKLFKLLLVLGLILPCGSALGQDADDEFTLEEIIVTAEFREKALQDTPLSITAISADMLESRNQVSLEQISAQAPNVSLRPGNASYGSSMVAYIRGIGQTDFNPSVEAGVGIYVDDVYYNTITGNLLDLLDLERVEVLRGPQGTLAGRNAIGGAIKLFSRKPEGRGEGYFSMTGGKFDRLDIRGAGDFAISDKLFVRIAGTSKSRDGYVTSYDYACKNNSPAPGNALGIPTLMSLSNTDCELGKEGGQSVTAGRISLRWIPNDDFEVNFSTNIVNDKSEVNPSVLVSARNMATQADPIPIFFDNNGDGVYNSGDVAYGNWFARPGTYMNYSTFLDTGHSTPNPAFQGGVPGQNIDVYKPHAVPRINHLDANDYTLTFDWNINENVALKSISSYREYTNIFADDNDGSPLAVQQLLQRMIHEQKTQEIRLNATLFDGFADATLGVFYMDAQTNEDARVNINYVGFDFIHGPDLVPSTSEALYGQSTLHLSDRMNLTLGARYSRDEKSYKFARHNADGSTIQPFDPTIMFDIGANLLGLPPGIVLGPFPFDANQAPNVLLGANDGVSVSYSSTQFDYRIALDYDVNDHVMVYGQIATGYKAGGNNARPFYPSQVNAFEPEELINYEIGVKSTLFDQLRLNASAFFNDYTEIQLPLSLCYFAPAGEQSPCASQGNVGDAEVKGIEIEGLWRPTRAFTLDFSYAYLDFQYTRINPVTPVDINSTTPFTPEHKVSLGAQYRFDLGKWGDVTHRVDYSWQDQVQAAAVVGSGTIIPSYGILNGRMTWRSEDLKWQASLETTNLLGKYYYLTVFQLDDGTGTIFSNGQPGRPQEWAFTLKRIWYFD